MTIKRKDKGKLPQWDLDRESGLALQHMTEKEQFPCNLRGPEPQRSRVVHIKHLSGGAEALRLIERGRTGRLRGKRADIEIIFLFVLLMSNIFFSLEKDNIRFPVVHNLNVIMVSCIILHLRLPAIYIVLASLLYREWTEILPL